MTGEMYLSTLRNGANFHKTNSVTEVTTSLSQLIDGTAMFHGHTLLTKFEQDLPNLQVGDNMFQSTKIANFNSNISNIKIARYMFCYSPLANFNSELSKLSVRCCNVSWE